MHTYSLVISVPTWWTAQRLSEKSFRPQWGANADPVDVIGNFLHEVLKLTRQEIGGLAQSISLRVALQPYSSRIQDQPGSLGRCRDFAAAVVAEHKLGSLWGTIGRRILGLNIRCHLDDWGWMAEFLADALAALRASDAYPSYSSIAHD